VGEGAALARVGPTPPDPKTLTPSPKKGEGRSGPCRWAAPI